MLTLMPNEKGGPVYRELPKNAETTYPYGSSVYAPEMENMLFGGSEILQGEARAIVVEIGKYTYLGAMNTFRVPAEVHVGESGEESLKELRSYFRVYGFLMLALLFVLAVIGVLLAPDDVGILDVFYPICVVCGVSSPALLLLYFKTVAMQETVTMLAPAEENDRVVIKVGRTTDRMNHATDLFLLGHKACSDGLLHLSSALVGGRVRCVGEADEGALQDLCEAFVLLNRASEGVTERIGLSRAGDGTLLRELIEASRFDLDALQIRLVRVAERRFSMDNVRCLDVQMNGKSFSLLFSGDPRIADRCRCYEDKGQTTSFSDTSRKALYSYCRESSADACNVICVVRIDESGEMTFVGAIAARERVQSCIAREVESLEKSGVRLSFFFEGEDSYERAFSNACGLSDARVTCSEEHPVLTTELLEDHRVFIGFSNEEILSVLKEIQKQRRSVGVLCGNAQDRRFLNAAAFTVVCDSTPFHKKGAEETVRADVLEDGVEHSAHAAQSMRRHADALILRATPEHGGLHALAEGIFASRAIGLRMRFLLSYLIGVNMLRVFLAMLCTLTGVGLPSGIWMLYSCLLLDVLSLKRILSLRIPRGYLIRSQRIDEEVLDKQIFTPERWMTLLIASGITVLYLAIWRWTGAITQEVAHAPILVFLLGFQLWILRSVTAKDGLTKDRSLWRSPAILLAIPLLVLIPLSIFIPAVGAVTGLGAWHPAALAAIPIFPLVYFLSRYFITIFYRTTK